MSVLSPEIATSLKATVTSPTGTFGAAMVAGKYYLFVSTVDVWIAQGATPTAAKSAGSMFVPAKTQVILDGACGADLAVLEDSSAGVATLARLRIY